MNQEKIYNFYRKLLQASEEFEREYPESKEWTMLNFAAWLNRRLALESDAATTESSARFPTPGASFETLEGSISKLVGFMHRYARIYLKKVLEGTDLRSPEEFGYLAGLVGDGSMSKIELIERNIHEKTSGMEILKRLLAAGLVEQTDHPEDRRSKLISITEKGRRQIFQIIPKLQDSARIVTGDLSENEKWQLLYLLQKLDRFHRPIFMEYREESLEEISARALGELGMDASSNLR